MEFEENSQKLVYGSKFNVRTAAFLGERTLIGIFSENMTDRPIFGRINQNSADKVHKPTIQKSKIIKKWFFFKKLILKMYHDEFWLRNFPQHLKFLFLMVRTHPMRNSSNINFLKNRLFWYFSNFTCQVKLFLEELNVRTTTWKFFQRILGTF